MKNIHSFVALEDTAMLDILLPNYDENTRFCNFYIEADTYLNDYEEDNVEHMDIEDKKYPELYQHKKPKPLKKKKGVGEKTEILYLLPPLDMSIELLQQKSELLEQVHWQE
jgi:hypothetical protein